MFSHHKRAIFNNLLQHQQAENNQLLKLTTVAEKN